MLSKLALLGVMWGTAATTNAAPVSHSPDLFVSSFFDGKVQRFFGPHSATPGAPHPAPGKSGSDYAGVSRRPWGIAFGPSGDLFVANQQGGDGAIMRINGPFDETPGTPFPAPGQSADVFVASGNYLSLAFGLDQNLYTGGGGPIMRFDVSTGASLGAFTSGSVPSEVDGIVFGPDMNLYVGSFDSATRIGQILRFNGKTGAFMDIFVKNGTGGLSQPGGLAFGPGGDIFVANMIPNFDYTSEVLRFYGPFSGTPGAPNPAGGLKGAGFVEMPKGVTAFQVAFGPDRSLYVTYDNGVLSYNGRTGALNSNFTAVPNARGLAFYSGN